MSGMRGWRPAALLLSVVLMIPAEVSAGPLFPYKHCPKPSYSPFHYWTPSLYRVGAHFHGPVVPLYAPDQAPGLEPRIQILRFPCPAVYPADFYSGRFLGFPPVRADRPPVVPRMEPEPGTSLTPAPR
ncbi:MAG TPA: hypothetical protein VNK04_13905 [Gemmataceae bacterium]|nr:hypothetical protein [Gemmataceae bacterium]